LQVSGLPGQRLVLEATTDLQSWQPQATNWLTGSPWIYEAPAAERKFYRATLR
jgi:hypothetical protein